MPTYSSSFTISAAFSEYSQLTHLLLAYIQFLSNSQEKSKTFNRHPFSMTLYASVKYEWIGQPDRITNQGLFFILWIIIHLVLKWCPYQEYYCGGTPVVCWWQYSSYQDTSWYLAQTSQLHPEYKEMTLSLSSWYVIYRIRFHNWSEKFRTQQEKAELWNVMVSVFSWLVSALNWPHIKINKPVVKRNVCIVSMPVPWCAEW